MLDEELGKNDGDFKTYTIQHIVIMKRPTNFLTKECIVGEVILPYSMYYIQNVIVTIALRNIFILFGVCILFHGIMIYDMIYGIIHVIMFYFAAHTDGCV